MEPDQYLGWVALALTPGLGPRLAGKLLSEFGTPEAVFNASLTALEAQRLPAAVAQAIHSRQPMSEAAKELAQAQAAGCRLLTWDETGVSREAARDLRSAAPALCARKYWASEPPYYFHRGHATPDALRESNG